MTFDSLEEIANEHNMVYYTFVDTKTSNVYSFFQLKKNIIFKIKLEALQDLQALMGEEKFKEFLNVALMN